MRLLCLNAWGGTLADALLPYLRDTAPDVLCLQEVVHSPKTTKTILHYRDGAHILPQRANLLTDVAAMLPGYSVTFCPAARGPLWDGNQAIDSFWGLATFVHPDLVVTAQAQGFVHKSYSHDGYGDHPRSRSAHAIRLHDQTLGGVSITQMHGLRDTAGKHDTPERAAQALRLLELSRSVTEPGDLAVICGDFNTGPDSETCQMIRGAGLTDLVTAGGHLGTRSSHYAKPGKFADYMFINQPDKVRHFDVVRTPEVSDHCPLVLDL